MATPRLLMRNYLKPRSYGLVAHTRKPFSMTRHFLPQRYVTESLPEITDCCSWPVPSFKGESRPMQGLESVFPKRTEQRKQWLQIFSDDDDGGGNKNKNEDKIKKWIFMGKGGPNPGWIFLAAGFAYLLYLSRISIGSSEENLAQSSKAITFSELLHQKLGVGEVEFLKVEVPEDSKDSNEEENSNVSKVNVHMRRGVMPDGELITSTGPHFYFYVSSVKTFETKLHEAQVELGIESKDHIPVWYTFPVSTQNLMDIFMICIVLWLGFLVRAVSKGRVISRSFGNNVMKNSPFGAMTRAKTTIINPGSKGVVKMKDVAGMKEAKEEVQEFVSFLRDPERFQHLGAKMPKGALLTGPPGTGKTLLAKAVSAEAGVPFLSMAGSDFVEIIGGLGAARVRDLFKQAHKRAPCIVYIDEVDAVGRARTGSNNSGQRSGEYEQTLNQLLVEMDGMNTSGEVIVLASTNRPDVLDKALLRPGRFDRQVTIDLPTLPERKEIFDVYLRKLKLSRRDDMFDYYAKRLAELTPGKSGADIANICNEAAFHAARMDQKSVDQENFEYAIERVIAGIESTNNALDPLERKTIAYHEAGHVIVSWMLEHTEPVLKISTRPRNSSPFGFKQEFPMDHKLQTNEQLFHKMCTLLGGRVAESIVFGRVTTGAEDDIDKVTEIAYQQIVTFGMNENIGPISFPVYRQGEATKKPYSDALALQIDQEVSKTLMDVRRKTTEILEAHRDKLDILATALLENEVLNYEDLVKLLGPSPHGDKVKKYYSKKTLSDALD